MSRYWAGLTLKVVYHFGASALLPSSVWREITTQGFASAPGEASCFDDAQASTEGRPCGTSGVLGSPADELTQAFVDGQMTKIQRFPVALNSKEGHPEFPVKRKKKKCICVLCINNYTGGNTGVPSRLTLFVIFMVTVNSYCLRLHHLHIHHPPRWNNYSKQAGDSVYHLVGCHPSPYQLQHNSFKYQGHFAQRCSVRKMCSRRSMSLCRTTMWHYCFKLHRGCMNTTLTPWQQLVHLTTHK